MGKSVTGLLPYSWAQLRREAIHSNDSGVNTGWCPKTENTRMTAQEEDTVCKANFDSLN